MPKSSLFDEIEDEDVKRERVRAIFALGAIALLFYLRQMNHNEPVTLIPIIWPMQSPLTGDVLMGFWGLYVLTMAIAFAGGGITGRSQWRRGARWLLGCAYGFGRVFYIVSVLFLLMSFAYFVAGMILVLQWVIVIPIIAVTISAIYPRFMKWKNRRGPKDTAVTAESKQETTS